MFSFAPRCLTGADNPDVLVAVWMGDHQNPAGARHSNGDKTLFRYGMIRSGYVTAKGSPNTVAASWNETRCFRRFCLAWAGSHSKFTTLSYPAAARRSNHSPSTPSSRGVADTRSARTLLGFICLSRAPRIPPTPALACRGSLPAPPACPACPQPGLRPDHSNLSTFKRFVIYHFQIVLDRDHNHVVTCYLILSNHSRRPAPQAASPRNLCVLRVSALDSSSIRLTLNLQSEVRRLSRPEIPTRSGLSTFNRVSFLSPSSPHLCDPPPATPL